MRSVVSAEVWKRKTVQFAISMMRLIQLMNAVAEVELRSPARECPECPEEHPQNEHAGNAAAIAMCNFDDGGKRWAARHCNAIAERPMASAPVAGAAGAHKATP